MTEREKELGYCDEAQTYCSVAEDRYKQGRVEGIREFAKYLVLDGYIRYGFEADYLVNQFMKKEKNNDKT